MWTFWTQKVDFLNLTPLTLIQKPHFWPVAGGCAMCAHSPTPTPTPTHTQLLAWIYGITIHCFLQNCNKQIHHGIDCFLYTLCQSSSLLLNKQQFTNHITCCLFSTGNTSCLRPVNKITKDTKPPFFAGLPENNMFIYAKQTICTTTRHKIHSSIYAEMLTFAYIKYAEFITKNLEAFNIECNFKDSKPYKKWGGCQVWCQYGLQCSQI